MPRAGGVAAAMEVEVEVVVSRVWLGCTCAGLSCWLMQCIATWMLLLLPALLGEQPCAGMSCLCQEQQCPA
jgi:hypothetical protein